MTDTPSTAVVERQPPKPPIASGGSVMAIVPQNLDEVWRMSTAIASAQGMAPKGFDTAEKVMVAIMAGAELGLPPFQSLQSFAVVNGRPTLWGDGLLAIVLREGVRVTETIEGEGDDMIATCSVVRPNGVETVRTFSAADAKAAGLLGKDGPWKQYRRRMMAMRARSWAIRDGCADMTRGIQVREEVDDYSPVRDVTPGRPESAKFKGTGARPAGGFSAPAPRVDHTPPGASHDVVVTADGEIVEDETERFPQTEKPDEQRQQPETPETGRSPLEERADAAIERIATLSLRQLESTVTSVPYGDMLDEFRAQERHDLVDAVEGAVRLREVSLTAALKGKAGPALKPEEDDGFPGFDRR